MRYQVKLQHGEEGYAVWYPSLPEYWSQGETKQEALENTAICRFMRDSNSSGQTSYEDAWD